ncbi:hypothetical protein Fot_14368 [Forsythia ovata]|uniref:Uncharacterized protein n=1 Tax=Forsythia ovata TaxID=205694 RepID=A0ABD1W9Q6_9LAMI
MKVDELRSTITGAKDIDELRSKNKILRFRLVISEDARAQAEYKITKSKNIQRLSFNDRKQAELTDALVELSKVKELLAKLGAPWLYRSKRVDRRVGIIASCNICSYCFHKIY